MEQTVTAPPSTELNLFQPGDVYKNLSWARPLYHEPFNTTKITAHKNAGALSKASEFMVLECVWCYPSRAWWLRVMLVGTDTPTIGWFVSHDIIALTNAVEKQL